MLPFLTAPLPAAALTAASPVSNPADALLTLQEQQAESLDTLDTTSTTTFMADGVTRTLKTRVLMDKPNGRMKIQHFTDSGEIATELLVEGTAVYVRGRQNPTWQQLPMDAQTQATLATMGVNFGSASQGGLAGLPRSDGAALAAAVSPQAASAVAARRGTPEARLSLLRRRHWGHADLARADARIQRQLAARKQHQRFERLRGADDSNRGLKAIRCRFAKADVDRPWDEELVKVDADGQAVERRQFIRADRWPGGVDKIPADAPRWHQVVPGVASDMTDSSLVELGRSTVISSQTIHGATVPQEAEMVSHSYLGTVTLHTKWDNQHVNEVVDPREFDLSR